MDIEALAESVVKQAVKLGASDCDVIVTDTQAITAEIEKSSMKQASAVSDPGVGVRVFIKGCAGFSYCTGHESQAVKQAVSLAVSQSKSGTPDLDFKGLPEKAKPAKVAGLYERKLAQLGHEDVVSMAIAISDQAGADRRITSVNAGVSVALGDVALANSNGFVGYQKLSAFEAFAESVAKSNDDMFSGVDGGWSRRYDSKMLERIAETAKEHALLGLRKTTVKTGDYPVILDPMAAGFILVTALGGGANGESVQRKRSFLAGRLGQKVGSESFSVRDDPTIAWANGSFSFDGEGVPARKKNVVKKGMLESYLYDSYSAGKDSVKSTGNSSRGGSMWTYRRPPSISSTNLVVEPGDATLNEMLQDTKNGIYLRITYDYPNLATGEFSGLMMESYIIEKGELGPSIRQASMGIDLIEMFSAIDLVGKEAKDAYGVRTPPIRISKAKIAGSG